MSGFRIGTSASSPGEAGSPWSIYGLQDNPFPASGIDSGVLYTSHIEDAIGRVNGWLSDVEHAVQRPQSRAGAVSPLAIQGANGSGKSHLLTHLQRGLGQNSSTPVLRQSMTAEGMGRIVFSSLLLRHLPSPQLANTEADSSLPLLESILEWGGSNKDAFAAAIQDLGSASPLKAPFAAIARADAYSDPDFRAWLSRYLRREYTTPSQRSKLGLAGVLTQEGEAIRAIADLLRMARSAQILDVWYVFIDQLEDLWGPAISSTRRARFLVDLRTLVDEAMEGCPIALLLTWNTKAIEGSRGFRGTVDRQLQRDYNALWERLATGGEPVRLFELRDEDLWPFAMAYLIDSGVSEDGPSSRAQLFEQLKRSHAEVLKNLEPQASSGSGHRHSPRRVLAAWRNQALTVASRRVR